TKKVIQKERVRLLLVYRQLHLALGDYISVKPSVLRDQANLSQRTPLRKYKVSGIGCVRSKQSSFLVVDVNKVIIKEFARTDEIIAANDRNALCYIVSGREFRTKRAADEAVSCGALDAIQWYSRPRHPISS